MIETKPLDKNGREFKVGDSFKIDDSETIYFIEELTHIVIGGAQVWVAIFDSEDRPHDNWVFTDEVEMFKRC